MNKDEKIIEIIRNVTKELKELNDIFSEKLHIGDYVESTFDMGVFKIVAIKNNMAMVKEIDTDNYYIYELTELYKYTEDTL